MIPPPPTSTLFPYTTLFRSEPDERRDRSDDWFVYQHACASYRSERGSQLTSIVASRARKGAGSLHPSGSTVRTALAASTVGARYCPYAALSSDVCVSNRDGASVGNP